MAIFILKIPELGTAQIGDALEWVFFVALPNFCFSKALQELITKHQFAKICAQIDERMTRTEFCDLVQARNKTNLCCPGE